MVVYCIVLYCSVLYCSVLYCIVLYCIIVYYFVLHFFLKIIYRMIYIYMCVCFEFESEFHIYGNFEISMLKARRMEYCEKYNLNLKSKN
jgi:hypothetical protein